jgi:hypothetical protein
MDAQQGVSCVFGGFAGSSTLADDVQTLFRSLSEQLGATLLGKWTVDVTFKMRHGSRKKGDVRNHHKSRHNYIYKHVIIGIAETAVLRLRHRCCC